MKHVILGVLLTVLTCTQALADWDPAADAREQAEQAAQQRAEQEQQRSMQRMKDAAQAEADRNMMVVRRKTLGDVALGKTDAEVILLYDAQIKKDTEAANQAAKTAREAMSSEQGAEALKQVTGKSMAELENMSDEEADALSREMEKKYGQ